MKADPYIGTCIGGYRIDRLLGRGGMGIVYLATDVERGGAVALKLMLPELAADPGFRKRFVQEAELAPTLGHPNIVQILAAGEADGELYLAMEVIEGFDLKTMIHREGPIEPARAVGIFSQVASALDFAHANGVVHRDVKPQNILIRNEEGRESAFIGDFGLVKRVSSASAATRSGDLLGSIHYISPEQIQSFAVDGRADVYALACVVFEALTGHVPFDRDIEASVLLAHIEDVPTPMSKSNPALPAGMDDAVLKALEKNPEDRFLTCGEFVDELRSGMGRKRRRTYSYRALKRRQPAKDSKLWSPGFFPESSASKAAASPEKWLRTTALVALAVAILVSAVRYRTGIGDAVATGVDVVQGVLPRTDETSAKGKSDRGSAELRSDSERREQQADRKPGEATRALRDAKESSDGIEAKDQDVAPRDRSVAPPVPLALPRSGAYTYVQEGYEEVCRDVSGYETCTGGRELPARQTTQVYRRRVAESSAVVQTAVNASDRWTSTTVTRHTGEGIYMTEFHFRLSGDGAFEAAFRPDSPMELLRLPATPGESWDGRWNDSDDATSATYTVRVERDSVRVNGRRVQAVVIRTTTTFTGSFAGDWEESLWLDASSWTVLRRNGSLALGTHDRRYQANYASMLRTGPGY